MSDEKDPKIKLKKTNRGFVKGEFSDADGNACSIQESSLADESRLWLGMDTGIHHMGVCMARMHLSREGAAKLIPLLTHFVDTGELPTPK